MNVLFVLYKDMMLSMSNGQRNGKKSISKPLYLISIIEAIGLKHLTDNRITFDNVYIRQSFGKKFEEYNKSNQGYGLSFFLRPFFHLGSSDFYHLVWKDDRRRAPFAITPSGKYLREHLSHAELDPELWVLLQEKENREFFKQSIINHFLSK